MRGSFMTQKKRSTRWSNAKAKLAELDHKQLLAVIRDLYDSGAANRRFLHARFLPSGGTFEEYRQRVADAIYPDPFSRRRISLRDANAAIAPSSGSGRSFSGMASFYGNESGSRTASGQHFNQNALTCAHRSLPFGTKLRVTHGDRSVIVTVNDRGPFVRGRVLDLSTAAARAVGIAGSGVGRVVAEVM